MSKEKSPQLRRLRSDYHLTVGCLCGNLVLCDTGLSLTLNQSPVSTMICGHSGCVNSKAQRQGKNLPPMADSVTMRERINYGDNSHIINGHSLVNQQPMREIATIVAGVFFCLNKKGSICLK